MTSRYPWDERSAPLVLALTGGGFRGYFTSLILARIEEEIGAPLYKVFNLISGTSIGGIIALGLAFGVPARTIANTISDFGPLIFPPYKFKKIRRAFGPPYLPEPIESALLRLLPKEAKQPIANASQNVMVITVSYGTSKMDVLSSWDNHRTGKTSVLDAALATSAAPTYFPAHRFNLGGSDVDFIDGGVAANAPDAVTLERAVTELAFPENRIALLSVGTCAPTEGDIFYLSPLKVGYFGALSRLGGQGIVNLAMAIQEERGIRESAVRLGQDRYLRLDRPPSSVQAKLLDLDNASEISRRTLEALADDVYQDFLSKGPHNVVQLVRSRAQAAH